MDMDFAARGLFGGNITVEFPRDWIDASDRQPVPDHQEAFLSRTGPFGAELIFEITDPINPRDQGPIGDHDPNSSAVKYYLDDLTDVTNDAWKTVEGPRKVSFELASMHHNAAYYIEAEITHRRASQEDRLHNDHPDKLQQPHSWLYLLLVRVPQYESEFVVQLIVKNGELPASTNSCIAKEIMNRIVKTLNFKNFKALIPTPSGNMEQKVAMATDGEE